MADLSALIWGLVFIAVLVFGYRIYRKAHWLSVYVFIRAWFAMPKAKTRCSKCGYVTNKIKVGRLCPKCKSGVMLDIDDYLE